MLAKSLQQAIESRAPNSDRLTLLGIQPTSPDASLGYLTPFPDSEGDVRPLQQFFEKPDQEQATRLIQAGSVWNSGITVGLLQAALYLYSRHADLDFSRDILQKQPARLQMLLVPACGWNDVGTLARLATTLRTLRPRTADTAGSASDVTAFNLSTALSSAFTLNRSATGLDALPPD